MLQPAMRTRIKLCEFESPDAAFEAATLGVDALGFHIFRHQEAEAKARRFASWLRWLPPGPEPVLLSDLPRDELLRVLRIAPFGTVQLYPDWSRQEVCEFRRALPRALKILKVVSAVGAENTPSQHKEYVEQFDPVVDGYLLDSCRRGGSGMTADWNLCARFVASTHRPVYLAGGLTPQNVAAALRIIRPHGVDVESGVSVRVQDFGLLKNLHRCRAFVEAVKVADANID